MEELAPQESAPVETPEPSPLFETDTPDEPKVDPVDDSEEIDYEGEKFKVPPKLKDAFLRKSDYTTKTQTLAQQRHEFETAQQQFVQRQQFHQAHIQAVAKVMAIDERLGQFQALDWNALTDADPVQALKLDRQMRELQGQRNQHVQAIDQAQSRVQFENQQATARNLESANAQLARDIPGFDKAETKKALLETGKQFGYKPEELAQVNDPRAVKLLHKAYLYDQLVAKTKASEADPEIKPITRVTGSVAPSNKNIGDANLSDTEYNRLRRDYIKKHR